MLTTQFGEVKTILCLGAHSDDIEIGCGGAVLTLKERYPDAEFHWVVFSGNEVRASEARAAANQFLAGAKSREIVIKDFRDGFFPYQGAQVKEFFEEIKLSVSPDLVFTHYGRDLHQDHRLMAELTWNTFRNHQILEYEIPKYDGGLGSPNFFVPLAEEHYRRKVEILMKCFETQAGKPWFTEDLFLGLARLRGMECNAPSRFAEAFYTRKIRLG